MFWNKGASPYVDAWKPMGYWVYLQAKQEPDRRHRTSWHIVWKRVTCNRRSCHGDRACFLLDEVLLGLANPFESLACRMIAITTIISGPGTFYHQSYFAILFQRILSPFTTYSDIFQTSWWVFHLLINCNIFKIC